jgi:endonuclease IV
MSETKNLKLFKHEEPLGTNNNKFDIDKALNQNWDKVDEYVEKVNTEISNIQEKIGDIDTILDTINGEVI